MNDNRSIMDLGELSRTIIRDDRINPDLCSPAPQEYIDESKDAILFIGMNPAGGIDDANRDKKTSGLFLNYYDELQPLIDRNPGWSSNIEGNNLIYRSYFKPILDFFKDATNNKEIAWEWCNCDFDELIEKIKKVREINEVERKTLRECYEKYKSSKYQIIVRDLVYYHQTKGFNKILKPTTSQGVRKAVVQMLDSYIEMMPKGRLKLIYISSATSCNYVEDALANSRHLEMKGFGGFIYESIPLILAGRPLNGSGVIDAYSRARLLNAVKKLLNEPLSNLK